MEVAGANRRWRCQFRCRGSRRESAVAQLFSLGCFERTMKFTPIILALSLLLTACSGPDAKLSRQIVGTWTHHDYGGQTEYVYAPNGSFSGDTTITETQSRTNAFAGTWRIQDGVLILTYTNVPEQSLASAGTVLRYKIRQVDDHQLLAGDAFYMTR